MNSKFYLVQRINSYCCERLSINDLYLGSSEDKAFEIYQNEIKTFVKDTYEDLDLSEEEKEKKINLEIDETKTYWEYCNDDGDNIVIMINEYELEVPVLNA